MTDEKRDDSKKNSRKKKQRPPVSAGNRLLVITALVLFSAVLAAGGMLLLRRIREASQPDLASAEMPSWIHQELLDVNPYSRPGETRETVRDIVVHYVANPGTSAENNRDYFNSLALQTGEKTTSASSHFIIGIDGGIIQCVPLEEIAYANYPRNDDTISIECCHPDETGEFTEATTESLIRLTTWLCQELNLTEHDVIRHYDVIGKDCPLYYVKHEDAWDALKAEIRKRRKES